MYALLHATVRYCLLLRDMLLLHARNPTRQAIRNYATQALHRDLFCEGNPIPVKWALERMGKLPSGLLRLPLVELSELYHTRVETALAQVRIIRLVATLDVMRLSTMLFRPFLLTLSSDWIFYGEYFLNLVLVVCFIFFSFFFSQCLLVSFLLSPFDS